ncbi:uncharacterized protein LOC120251232 [Dioscorea cayenensis subsp. rotundata]|uniref:Uncharacterized protein LOC120251232 n=1 Tax=Dioscorea cayennensis subsp. rotundata TaxID=55577 RepID=A0AB40AN95_DIOCR|nr:uncharacterized protein LOC120251232 [Dioscorea cayenensis subsp. rotundata]
MAGNGVQVLKKLRRGIRKVMFLLSFNAKKWFISSSLKSPNLAKLISFKDQPSLINCYTTDEDEFYEVGSSLSVSRTSSSASEISRTISSASATTDSSSSSGDDINVKAEAFIASFYKHIQMEREVSLKLRYCKPSDDDLERTKSF